MDPNPFDVKAIVDSIERAASPLEPGQRGLATIEWKSGIGFGAGIVVRAPKLGRFDPKILATVTKPQGGKWGVGFSGVVSFAIGELEPAQRGEVPLGVHYEIFRALGNGQGASMVKAIRAMLGFRVTLGGKTWEMN